MFGYDLVCLSLLVQWFDLCSNLNLVLLFVTFAMFATLTFFYGTGLFLTVNLVFFCAKTPIFGAKTTLFSKNSTFHLFMWLSQFKFVMNN